MPAPERPAQPRKRAAPAKDVVEQKQRLVRTIALGNLSAGTRMVALRMAKAAGKVLFDYFFCIFLNL